MKLFLLTCVQKNLQVLNFFFRLIDQKVLKIICIFHLLYLLLIINFYNQHHLSHSLIKHLWLDKDIFLELLKLFNKKNWHFYFKFDQLCFFWIIIYHKFLNWKHFALFLVLCFFCEKNFYSLIKKFYLI